MRLEVTRKSDLAICGMIVLNDSHERLKSGQLATRLDAAPAFMAQVMTPLVKRGWVESGPGPTGGYRMLVDLSQLSVLDVIEAVEGPTDGEHCVVANSPCGDQGFCALHHAWTEARAILLAHLAETSLESVLGGRLLYLTTQASGGNEHE